MKKLNDKQKRFCEEYIVDLNATQAALRSGYSKKTSGSIGHDLLKKPEIETYISELAAKRSKRTEITSDRVLKALGHIAFADFRELFTPGGHLLDVHNMSDEVAAALASIEVVTSREEEDEDGNRNAVEFTHKIKMNDRVKALELLGRHLKMFTDKVEHSGDVDLLTALSAIDGKSKTL